MEKANAETTSDVSPACVLVSETVLTRPEPYDVTGNIIAYEQGELTEAGIVELFQELVNTGLAWQLQGSYGRMAAQLLEAGWITRPGQASKPNCRTCAKLKPGYYCGKPECI